MTDKFKDECGVFGVCNHADAVTLTMLGLTALQHRGQESAGIAARCHGTVAGVTAMGPVSELMRTRHGLSGSCAIGHVRYSTTGASALRNAQPVVVGSARGLLALCHNGNVMNASSLRGALATRGVRFTGESDSEVMARRFADLRAEWSDVAAVRRTFEAARGAYSILMLTTDQMFALRDPFGIRPLSVGRLGEAIVVSSETCALDAIGAAHVRDVRPSEILVLGGEGIQSIELQPTPPTSGQCIFELVYFSRPDSVVFGDSVAEVRLAAGRQLAREQPADADIVVPVPASGLYAGVGYAKESGIELEMALVRNHAVARTFIDPDLPSRRAAVGAKYFRIRYLLAGRRVVLVDDSLVRGTTCRHLVARLREAGAREVHLRLASPPTVGPCHLGVDTPDEKELFAVNRTIDEMARLLDVQSLGSLSLEGLLASMRQSPDRYCTGCYSGRYPDASVCGEAVATIAMET